VHSPDHVQAGAGPHQSVAVATAMWRGKDGFCGRDRLDEASEQDGRRWGWTRHRSQMGRLSHVDARSRLTAAGMLQELPRAGWLPLAACAPLPGSYPSKQCLSADSEIRFNFMLISESFHKQIAVLSIIACHAWRNVRTLHNTIASNKPPGGIAVSGRDLSINVTWCSHRPILEIRARVLGTKSRHDLRDCRVN
jgi:hypothetical protein